MSKITIDLPNGMPKSCQDCKLCDFNLYDEEPHCDIIGLINKNDFMDMRHPQCPLQEPKSISDEGIEEALKQIGLYYAICSNPYTKTYARHDPNFNIIEQTLINQQEEIKSLEKTNKLLEKDINKLNDTLEITVIAEMLDLIKNGTPIPPTRKELQSKLDEYEKLIKELFKNPIILSVGRTGGKTHLCDTIDKLKQLLKDAKNE